MVSDAEKEEPVCTSFVSLGVNFDLVGATTWPKPFLVVSNKKSRIESLRTQIQDILHRGIMSSAEAAQLRGKLVFANSQTFGRIGAVAFAHLSKRTHSGSPSFQPLEVELKWALEWWLQYLKEAKPRFVPLAGVRKPLIILTDGACEPDETQPYGIRASYGGVMFDPEDNAYEVFGGNIGPSLMEFLSHDGSKTQVVGQAELLPCLAARRLWKERCANRPVLNFVDNEAARYALIKGTSPTMDSAVLTAAFWKEESGLGAFSWFERVPSPSNLADNPSRGKPPEPLCQGTPHEIKPVRVEIPTDFEEELAAMWASAMAL